MHRKLKIIDTSFLISAATDLPPVVLFYMDKAYNRYVDGSNFKARQSKEALRNNVQTNTVIT